MTEPSSARPTPGPPSSFQTPENTPVQDRAEAGRPFEDLDQRPVAEHVAVFETEHARLQRELGTIDQL